MQNETYFDPEIEVLRKRCLLSRTVISPSFFGVGSRSPSKARTLGNIADKSLSPKEQNAFFASVVKYMKCKTILELGTSLGINASYLAKASTTSAVYTLEGDPNIAELAKENFASLGLNNVQCIIGNFNSSLPVLLKGVPSLDFVFLDGNHKYEATLSYFEMCLPKVHANTIFIFHDIYWSPEMSKAWKELYARPEVTLSIDFFYFGVVFFRSNQPKQHFVLKF